MEPETGALAQVFVSYRSQDVAGAEVAVGLAERLKRDLGSDWAYYAPSDNRLTEDWVLTIEERLVRAHLVIAVIGPSWERGGGDACLLDDPDDWVRREVAHAAADDDTDLLPVFVGRRGVADPSSLPEDIRAVATTHGLADFDLVSQYQDVLMQAWASFHARQADVMLVVSDASTSGLVAIDELVATLRRRGEVDLDRLRLLSQVITAPPGTAAVPLRTASKDFPAVLVLEPQTVGEHWRQRRAAMEQWVARNPGQTLRLGAAGSITAGTLGVSAPQTLSWWTAGVRRAGRTWRGLDTSARVGVAVAAAAAVVGGGVVLLGGSDPDPVTFADYVWDLEAPVVAGQVDYPGLSLADGHRFITVNGRVDNPNVDDFPSRTAGYDPAIVHLVHGQDRLDPERLVDPISHDSEHSIDVPPSGGTDYQWVFEVEDAVDPAALDLELGEASDRPIRFDGDTPTGVLEDQPATLAPMTFSRRQSDRRLSLDVDDAFFTVEGGQFDNGSPRPSPD